MPVLQLARQHRLPLDIIVQPQAAPGETPLGMAFIDGRCKLVLSMRGNPEARATLDRIEPALRGPVLESIAAHELGHCWWHVQRQWGSMPGAVQHVTALTPVRAEHAELLRDMWRTRREEAFADLVGLAWTPRHHPQRFEQVQELWMAGLLAHGLQDRGRAQPRSVRWGTSAQGSGTWNPPAGQNRRMLLPPDIAPLPAATRTATPRG